MAQVIAIVSGKGGVGKTTATANIGTALAGMGYKVLLIDGDFGLRNLDIALGLSDSVVYHLGDVLAGDASLDQALLAGNKYPGLRFLATPQGINAGDIDPDGFPALVSSLRPQYDYIIIDCAAGIGDALTLAASCCDRALVVTTPETIAIRGAEQAAVRLEGMGISTIHLIINRINPDMMENGDMVDVDTVIQTVAIPLIGAVPEDAAVLVSNNRGAPIVLQGKARPGIAFFNIAKRVTGQKIPIMKDEKKRRFGLFKRKR